MKTIKRLLASLTIAMMIIGCGGGGGTPPPPAPTPNNAPVADAGSDVTVTEGNTETVVECRGSDTDGTITNHQITNSNGDVLGTTSYTTVSNLNVGVYTFTCTVADDDGAQGSDTVDVTVQAAPNAAPTANAGSDVTVTEGNTATTLTCSGSDADGDTLTYRWSLRGVEVATTATYITQDNLTIDTYEYTCIVSDGQAAAGDRVIVTVQAAPNNAPVANAGSDVTVTEGNTATTLTCSGTDADGDSLTYSWTLGGVEKATTASYTTPNDLATGTHEYTCTVSDGQASSNDNVVVEVQAAPEQNTTIVIPGTDVDNLTECVDGPKLVKVYELDRQNKTLGREWDITAITFDGQDYSVEVPAQVEHDIIGHATVYCFDDRNTSFGDGIANILSYHKEPGSDTFVKAPTLAQVFGVVVHDGNSSLPSDLGTTYGPDRLVVGVTTSEALFNNYPTNPDSSVKAIGHCFGGYTKDKGYYETCWEEDYNNDTYQNMASTMYIWGDPNGNDTNVTRTDVSIGYGLVGSGHRIPGTTSDTNHNLDVKWVLNYLVFYNNGGVNYGDKQTNPFYKGIEQAVDKIGGEWGETTYYHHIP